MRKLHLIALMTLSTLQPILAMESKKIDFRLHQAVKHSDLAWTQQLLATGADVNAKDDYGIAPLLYAAKYGNVTLCELLLKHNANPNIQDLCGSTPLMRTDLESICRVLLEYGADVNIQDDEGDTALMYDAWREGRGTSELIIKHETIHTNQFIAFLCCCKQICPKLYLQKDLLKDLWKNWTPQKLLSKKNIEGKTAWDYLPVHWLKPQDMISD